MIQKKFKKNNIKTMAVYNYGFRIVILSATTKQTDNATHR